MAKIIQAKLRNTFLTVSVHHSGKPEDPTEATLRNLSSLPAMGGPQSILFNRMERWREGVELSGRCSVSCEEATHLKRCII